MAEQIHSWIANWLEAAQCSWSGSCSAVKRSVVGMVLIVVVVVVVSWSGSRSAMKCT